MQETPNCHYDYANKCDCSEDDKCGCDYPNNLPHDYDLDCLNCKNYNAVATDAPMTTSAFDNITEEITYKETQIFISHSAVLGKLAPDFTAPALLSDNTIVEHLNLYKYTQNQNAVLFFYPEDFTFTCPSELLLLNDDLNSFIKRNTKIIAISTDSIYSHLAWKELPLNKDGIPDIKFPLIADLDKTIAQTYGVLNSKETATRATFIIDKHHIIRHISLNDMNIRRNTNEIIRIIDILNQKSDDITACPTGWKQNFPFERPEQQTLIEIEQSHASQNL